MISKRDGERHFSLMLSGALGFQDDLDANMVPEEAKQLPSEVMAICRRDFEGRFLGDR
jgi:hypothetical protein